MSKPVADEEKVQDVKTDGTDTKEDLEVKSELKKVDEALDTSVKQPKRKLRLPVSKKKRWLIAGGIIIGVIVVLGAIPYTRYNLLGLFMKEKYTVTVTDSVTKTPVTGATVRIGGQAATTDASGKVTITVPVGDETVVISKQYYKDSTTTVRVVLSTPQNTLQLAMVATGRQVPVTVVNKINGKPVAGITLKALDTTATTDVNGKATIVLPTKADTQQATLSGGGYNTLTAPITVTSSNVPANTFAIMPAGRVYFLSNLSGKIDVVSTNLDGSNRTTVLAGTGTEDSGTVLLASRDWKYLALQSKRDTSNAAKIYLITTATNSVSVMDEGTNVSFQFIGWSDDNFVYTVDRSNALLGGTVSQTALKAFNTATGHITTIDQTDAQQSTYDAKLVSSLQASLLSDGIVYTKFWSRTGYFGSSSLLAGKTQAIVKTKPDGSNPQTLKTYDAAFYQSVQLQPDSPSELYYRVGGFDLPSGQRPWEYFKYDDTTVQPTTEVNDNTFYSYNPTYLRSPSGDHTFWSVPTDGKSNLFVGDKQGNNGANVGTLSDYNPYGWFTDDYLLVSKGGDELYIMPKGGGAALKITDYYRPSQYFYGYGGGYGGI